MTVAIGAAAVALYLGTTWRLAGRLSSSVGVSSTLAPAWCAAFGLALILHGVVLADLILGNGGLRLGFFNAVSLIGWVICALVLATAVARPADSLGLFVLPLAAVSVLFALLFPDASSVPADLDTGTKLHVLVSVVAYGLLALAALQATLVWLQDRALRARRLRTSLGTLPPLTSQESLLFQLMGAGFFFLSLSLVSGFMFVDDLLAQHLAHKSVLAALAWCVFGTLLWGRWRHGWRGRSVVRWSLVGFVCLALAYFGAKLVLELVLDRSWTR